MHWFAALTPTERVVSLRSADVVFGSDQKGKQAVASVPASKDPYNMGESRLWVWFEFGRHASID